MSIAQSVPLQRSRLNRALTLTYMNTYMYKCVHPLILTLLCCIGQTLTHRDMEYHLSEGRALALKDLTNGSRIRTRLGQSLIVMRIADFLNPKALVRHGATALYTSTLYFVHPLRFCFSVPLLYERIICCSA